MRSDPFAKVVLPTKSDPVVQEEKLVWVCVCVCPKQKDSRLIVHLFFPRYNCFRVHPLFLDHVATGYGGYPPNGPGRTAKSHRVSFRTKESEQEREREREGNLIVMASWLGTFRYVLKCM